MGLLGWALRQGLTGRGCSWGFCSRIFIQPSFQPGTLCGRQTLPGSGQRVSLHSDPSGLQVRGQCQLVVWGQKPLKEGNQAAAGPQGSSRTG